MADYGTTNKNERWRPATNLVRGGTKRSDFSETSEGVFMTSGLKERKIGIFILGFQTRRFECLRNEWLYWRMLNRASQQELEWQQ